MSKLASTYASDTLRFKIFTMHWALIKKCCNCHCDDPPIQVPWKTRHCNVIYSLSPEVQHYIYLAFKVIRGTLIRLDSYSYREVAALVSTTYI
jgi:hypothetical protein